MESENMFILEDPNSEYDGKAPLSLCKENHL
jgi:hypothetical protein